MCNGIESASFRMRMRISLIRHYRMFAIYRPFFISLLTITFLIYLPSISIAYTTKDRKAYQRSIVDYRGQINPKFKKIIRKKTKYLIVHTSEGGLKSALRIISKGKRMPTGRKTRGGHANYVIAKDGRTYRILDKKYKAQHAGLSMWNGETHISNISIGIEMVGHNHTPITNSQYRSLSILINILQDVYNLDDKSVLTHSQIAYAKPNHWFTRNHRGRKYCAKNFARSKAGLETAWEYDPDVIAKRLDPDPKLSAIFYESNLQAKKEQLVHVIEKNLTAWAIAGIKFNSPDTLYMLPGGQLISGNRIDQKIGWHKIPYGTKVFLH
jgi:N-acetylmuramoyl-L-alanine amidase